MVSGSERSGQCIDFSGGNTALGERKGIPHVSGQLTTGGITRGLH